jgi:tetratricopeptide (TPR) repeat protein
MVAKILQPFTIIPDHLYVERDADRQIESIITHMQRPGYVLVSRQMGKTNLLVRAKRKFNSADLRFIYIDLSLKGERERDCFHNIVDTIFETNEDIKKGIASEIKANRKGDYDFEPRQEHLNELRSILKYYPGKIIIMLDEIDAMLNASYSDNLFSQIRSIYFSRENFPEFNRLTYILSGVVEPTEIIKNAKISPFNIGEKIYLNDFTEAEFQMLLQKSELNSKIEKKVVDCIYSWTAGNPRISFDVLNEVEDQYLLNVKIDEGTIEKVIKKLYLVQFDRPPIDHIRDLVQSDSEIRDAIIELHINKSNEISSQIKNKLYLYGIINFFDDQKVSIKNKIIKEALSYEWLTSLVTSEHEILQNAIQLQGAGDIEGAIRMLESFVNSERIQNLDKKFLDLYHFQLANAHLNLFRHEVASQYYAKINFNERSINSDVLRLYFYNYGDAQFILKNYSKAIELLEYFIKNDEKDLIYYKAIVSLANSYLSILDPEVKKKGFKIFEDLLTDLDTDITKKVLSDLKERNRIKAIVLHNLAYFQSVDGDKVQAEMNYDLGLKFAPHFMFPSFYLKKVLLKDDVKDRLKLLDELQEVITKHDLKPKTEASPEVNLGFTDDLWYEILYHSYKVSQQIFYNLLSLTEQKFVDLKKSREEFVYEVATVANSKSDFAIATELLRPILKSKKPDDVLVYNEDYFEVLRMYCLSSKVNENLPERVLHSQIIFNNDDFTVESDDLSIIANLLLYYVNERIISKGLELVNNVKLIEPKVDSDLKRNFFVLDYLEFRLIYEGVNKIQGKELGSKFLDKYVNTNEFKDLIVINDDQINSLKTDVEQKVQAHTPYVKSNKIERYQKVKVKYKDGSVIVNKYKKLEEDVNSGRCVVIEVYR